MRDDMKTIWKYEAPISDPALTIEMPCGAQLLCVQMQHNSPCIWALVDSGEALEKRHFAWRGTGHRCDGLKPIGHVGTVQMLGGDLVFHLFEVSE
jgi:hypothetical protein